MKLIAVAINKIINWANRMSFKYNLEKYPNISKLASVGVTSSLNGPIENFHLGDYSYINAASISWGNNSKVIIGDGCAIGYNVSIKAITHAAEKPTNNKFGAIMHVEQDIIIGDNVWIGDNVYVRDGVMIGNNSIVGANSVVVKSVEPNSVVAGVPAKFIKKSIH